VHSFRAFSYYWLQENAKNDSTAGSYAYVSGGSGERSALTNSPDENAKFTNCGKTLMGWYVVEKPTKERHRLCFWGHKVDSPTKKHFAPNSLAQEAEFSADGRVQLDRKLQDTSASMMDETETEKVDPPATHSVGIHVEIHVDGGAGGAAPSARAADKLVPAPPSAAPAEPAPPVEKVVAEEKPSASEAKPSEASVDKDLAKLAAKATGKSEEEMHKHITDIKTGTHGANPFKDADFIRLLQQLSQGMGDNRLGIQKQQLENMKHPSTNALMMQQDGTTAAPDRCAQLPQGCEPTFHPPAKTGAGETGAGLGDVTPVWSIDGLDNKKCPYSYVTKSEGDKKDSFSWADIDSSCPADAWTGAERHHGDHTPGHLSEMPSTESQQCGTCYAVASSTSLTSRLWIKYPELKKRWQKSKKQTGNSSVFGGWGEDECGVDVRVSWGHASQCNVYNQGCDGGFPYWVMTGWSDEGAKSTACFADDPTPKDPTPADGSSKDARPDKCTPGDCEEDPQAGVSGIQIQSWGYIGGAYGRCQVGTQPGTAKAAADDASMSCEEYMKREIYRAGPIVVAIEPEGGFAMWHSGVLKAANASFGAHVKSGKGSILHPQHFRNIEDLQHVPADRKMCPDGSKVCYHYEKVDHSVVVFGWGEEDGTPYWLLKNSWGNSFGDHGTIKIARGEDYLAIESIPVAAEPIWVKSKEAGFIDVKDPEDDRRPIFARRSGPYLSRAVLE